jgi:type VI secretion system protein ImpK
MAEDDPFGLRDREQRTVILRPQPGGRRPPGEAVPRPAPFEPLPAASLALPPVSGTGPLMAAVEPLLIVTVQLRGTEPPRDLMGLHGRIEASLRQLPGEVRGAVAAGDVDQACHAVAAFIDETVLNTPWGPRSEWPQRRLATRLFGDDDAGRSFFRNLEDAERDAARHRDLLEVMHACLALGFEGVFAVQPERVGRRSLAQIKSDLYRRLADPAAATALSPRWQGLDAPLRPERRLIPNWVAGVAALAILGLLYWGFTYRLSLYGDTLAALRPTTEPITLIRVSPVQPAPAPVQPVYFAPPAAPLLERERAAGQVEVAERPDAIMVRIRGDGLFASASAELQPAFRPLIERIGSELADRPGRVTVVGHTDSQPIRTARFPSNFELSSARAQSVASLLQRQLGPGREVAIEAAADTRPIADNATPEGRSRNRRIEILLRNG